MNILFCSAGRRVELLKDFRKSMDEDDRIIAADLSRLAPALYVADAHYLVPRIDAPDYLDTILDICRRENINAVTTLIDPEIELLAKNRARFEEIGVEVLAPYAETAELCFDKFKMYQYLTAHGVPTPDTWGDYASAMVITMCKIVCPVLSGLIFQKEPGIQPGFFQSVIFQYRCSFFEK